MKNPSIFHIFIMLNVLELFAGVTFYISYDGGNIDAQNQLFYFSVIALYLLFSASIICMFFLSVGGYLEEN